VIGWEEPCRGEGGIKGVLYFFILCDLGIVSWSTALGNRERLGRFFVVVGTGAWSDSVC